MTIISGTAKAISQGLSEQSTLKIWEKRERGGIQGLTKFFEYPLLSQEREKVRTSNYVQGAAKK